ncbi:hypothetical protein GobsT_52890 [Gemmata obscuriglobus]|uniref:Uncharacterized protein n=1 Tax=Gemmata obscuriglobus TaxID=114 RepID=A0A2Z3H149_9BACT|nr:hypothetical protein [Gemmata obscuriglobus]AWM36845.1 hypothetical protein C1280_07320 [Gemmata obscuriglobus]QEG30484.1 hypothetical protein GobsT_52890 [Gemmata obscuriglobus]VTS09808.1 unnamed protein product [Gemmata obscuriglobus UQM 2246]
MRTMPFQEPARLLFHLSGVSRVVLERFEGNGMAGGGEWDIPTELIPHELRAPGARFLLVGQFVRPETGDTAAELREAVRTLRVEAIGE